MNTEQKMAKFVDSAQRDQSAFCKEEKIDQLEKFRCEMMIKIEQLEANIKTLQKQYEDVGNKLEESRARVCYQEEHYKQMLIHVDDREVVITIPRGNELETCRKHEELKKTYQQLRKCFNQKDARITHYRELCQKLMDKVKTLMDKFKSRDNQKDEHIADLNNELEEIKPNYQQQIEAIAEASEDIARLRHQLLKASQQQEENIMIKEGEIVNLQMQKDSLKRGKDYQEIIISERERQIADLENQLKDFESSHHRYTKQVAELQRMKRLCDKLQYHQQQLKVHVHENISAKLKKFHPEFDRLMNQHQVQKAEHDKLKSRHHALEANLEDMKNQHQAEHNAFKNRYEAQEREYLDQIEAQKKKLRRLKTRYQSQEDENRDLKRRYQVLLTEHNHLKRRYQNQPDNVQVQQAELEELVNTYQSHVAANEALKNSYRTQDAECKGKKQRLDTAEIQMQEFTSMHRHRRAASQTNQTLCTTLL